eukprot:12425979-Karenia_brevis.AAC.1
MQECSQQAAFRLRIQFGWATVVDQLCDIKKGQDNGLDRAPGSAVNKQEMKNRVCRQNYMYGFAFEASEI